MAPYGGRSIGFGATDMSREFPEYGRNDSARESGAHLGLVSGHYLGDAANVAGRARTPVAPPARRARALVARAVVLSDAGVAADG